MKHHRSPAGLQEEKQLGYTKWYNFENESIFKHLNMRYLVSSSPAWHWSSLAELSTDKESLSQRGCKALWRDWGTSASQPDTSVNKAFTHLSLLLLLHHNTKPAGHVLTLFMENSSIWLFLRLKSLWTSLNTAAAPSRSPVAPWHTTKPTKLR